MATERVTESWLGVDAPMFGRNGGVPHGPFMTRLAMGLNHLLGRHGTSLPGMSVHPSFVRESADELRLWSTYYHATPNHGTLISRVVMLPTTNLDAESPSWYVKVDGVAATQQYHSAFGSDDRYLGNAFFRDQEIAVTPDEDHYLDLYTDDCCRVVGWYCWEKDVDVLDSTGGDKGKADTLVYPWHYRIGYGVHDLSAAQFDTALLALWRMFRGSACSWNVRNPASPVAATTSWVNPWDGSGARTADTVGARVPTQYRGNWLGTTIPIHAWALAERTSGSDEITIRFAGASTNTDIVCNSTLGFFDAYGTIDVAAAGDKVDLQIKATAGTTGNVYAAGFFPYVSP